MGNQFEINCPVCDILTIVEVRYDEDRPAHCPMCGEDVEPEPTDLDD